MIKGTAVAGIAPLPFFGSQQHKMVQWKPSWDHEVRSMMWKSHHNEYAEQTARTRVSEVPNLTSVMSTSDLRF